MTTDFGRTWSSLSGALDPAIPLHTVREDPEKQGLLYAGTETGVYLSFDGGARWQAFSGNLPAVRARNAISVTAPGSTLLSMS